MAVKRFIVVLTLLVVVLFVLVSSIDTTLDHLSKSGTQSCFVTYDEKGIATVTYNGDLSQCLAYNSVPPATSSTLHRVKPDPLRYKYGWL